MNYKTMRIATLRKIAGEKEIEGYEEMERDELVKALNTPEVEEVEKTPEKVEETDGEGQLEEPEEEDVSDEQVGITNGNVPVGSKAEIMKARLALQPKVTIMIPLEGKEKKGSTFPVTLNGYRLNIQKGVYVPVPKQVAEIVMDSQSQTVAAADELKRLDGSPVKISGESPSELN